MVQPVVVRQVHPARDARRPRAGGHLFVYSNGYDNEDKSIMAPHLFDGYTSSTDVQLRRYRLDVGCPLRRIAALSFTYLPKQEVEAWAWHDTEGGAGFFESVASVI
jgi:hypothetical protein